MLFHNKRVSGVNQEEAFIVKEQQEVSFNKRGLMNSNPIDGLSIDTQYASFFWAVIRCTHTHTHTHTHCTSLSFSQVSMTMSVVSSPSTVSVRSYVSSATNNKQHD